MQALWALRRQVINNNGIELYVINGPLASTRDVFNYTCAISVSKYAGEFKPILLESSNKFYT